MKLTTTPKGHLIISIDLKDPLDIDAVSEATSIEDFVATHFEPNGQIEQCRPEEIGALTAAPILVRGTTRDEDYNLLAAEEVWWFPAYETTDPLEILREKGEVLFTAAPK